MYPISTTAPYVHSPDCSQNKLPGSPSLVTHLLKAVQGFPLLVEYNAAAP